MLRLYTHDISDHHHHHILHNTTSSQPFDKEFHSTGVVLPNDTKYAELNRDYAKSFYENVSESHNVINKHDKLIQRKKIQILYYMSKMCKII